MENNKLVQWILRVAVAGEFAGHGLLALGGKADWILWVNKLSGMDMEAAAQAVYYIGVFDVAVAVIVLLAPIPVLLLWATFWGFWTALVRPLVGVGWLDFIERWANWGAPLALLLLIGWPRTLKDWFKPRF